VATRRNFTQEYNGHAVSVALDSGRCIAEVAEIIGVHEMTLSKGMKKVRESGRIPDKDLSEPERAELKRLRKGNVTLRLECDSAKVLPGSHLFSCGANAEEAKSARQGADVARVGAGFHGPGGVSRGRGQSGCGERGQCVERLEQQRSPGSVAGQVQDCAAGGAGQMACDGEDPQPGALFPPSRRIAVQGEQLGPRSHSTARATMVHQIRFWFIPCNGRLRRPLSFTSRTRSPARARRRCRSSRSASWRPGPPGRGVGGERSPVPVAVG
jgi:transposase